MGEPSRPIPALALAALLSAALIWLALIGALALRSTETWIPVEPALAQRLLDLTQDQRRLSREWETAQRGDARFELDTEIRVTAARIEELEHRAREPYRVTGLAPWQRLAPAATMLAAAAALTSAETLATLALAGLVAGVLSRLDARRRILALAAILAPLGLPPPLFATAFADLGRTVGLAPSPALAFVASIVVALPWAVIALHLAIGRRPWAEHAAAVDLGLSPWTIRRRIDLPVLAPALAITGLVVFLRLTSDLSIGRIVGGASPALPFGEWLRHRLVAVIDYPNAAAGVLVAFAAAAVFAAILGSIAARLAPPSGTSPGGRSTHRIAGAAPTGGTLLALVPAVIPLALVVALVRRGLEGTVSGGWDLRTAEAVFDLGRAALAGGLALLVAIAIVVVIHRSKRHRPGPVAPALLMAFALPPPMIGLGLRLLAEDFALPIGPWIAVLAQGLIAVGPLVVLLRDRLPKGRADGIDMPLAPILAPALPLAAGIGFALALAVADLGSILGLVDRTLLLRPPTLGLADPASLCAGVAALVVGLVGAWALETTRGRGLDP